MHFLLCSILTLAWAEDFEGRYAFEPPPHSAPLGSYALLHLPSAVPSHVQTTHIVRDYPTSPTLEPCTHIIRDADIHQRGLRLEGCLCCQDDLKRKAAVN